MKRKRDWGTFLHGLAGTAAGVAIGAGSVAAVGDAGFASAAIAGGLGAKFGREREKRQREGKPLSKHQRREGMAWGFGAALGAVLGGLWAR